MENSSSGFGLDLVLRPVIISETRETRCKMSWGVEDSAWSIHGPWSCWAPVVVCVEPRSVQTVVVRCYLLECGTAGPGPTPSPRLWPGHHWPRRRWSWAGCLQSAVWSPAITRTSTTSHHQLVTTQFFNTLIFKRLKTKQNVLVACLWVSNGNGLKMQM